MKRLCVRAIIPVTIAVTGFVVVCCLMLYSNVHNDMIRTSIEQAAHLADTIVKSTRYAMLRDDRDMLRNMVVNIGEQQEVTHVRIFNKKGLIMFSQNPGEVRQFVDKLSAGCVECHASEKPHDVLGTMEQAREFKGSDGEMMLGITAPIYNEPSCSTRACHQPIEEQKILGTLDIGLSQARLQGTLNLLRMRLTVFSGMVLLLTVGGVAALLRRSIFLPLCRLADFTERAVHGSPVEKLPLLSRELAQIVSNVNALVQQRDRDEAGRDTSLDDETRRGRG